MDRRPGRAHPTLSLPGDPARRADHVLRLPGADLPKRQTGSRSTRDALADHRARRAGNQVLERLSWHQTHSLASLDATSTSAEEYRSARILRGRCGIFPSQEIDLFTERINATAGASRPAGRTDDTGPTPRQPPTTRERS